MNRDRDDSNRDRPQAGDRLICLKNDKASGLYNGAQGTVLEVKSESFDSMDIVFQADDIKPKLHIQIGLWAFNKPKPERPSYPTKAIPFDYGYAITCHKAQGSEASRVLVFGNGWGRIEQKRRWLYTACTRAQDELYILL